MTEHIEPRTWCAALLLPLLFTAAAGAAEGGSGEAQKARADAIAASLKSLDHEEPAARDQAQKQLVEAGEPALEPIEAFLAASPSLEAKSRAQAAAAEIRRRARYASTRGGEAVGGLQATLRSQKDEFRAGEKIELEYELSNVGKKDIAAAPQKVLCVQGGEWFLSHTAATGLLKVTRVAGEKGKSMGVEACGRGPDSRTLPLKPGETRKTGYELNEILQNTLGPGTYDLQIVYFAKSHGLAPELEKDVDSNVLRIRVLGEDSGNRANAAEKR